MMRRTPLSRASGKRQEAARQAGSTFTGERKPWRAGEALERAVQPRKARRETGFPREVKEAVRARAAHHCEACGVLVPPGYGNIQHRRARKMGGSRNPIISSIANAVLLCGTPLTGDHGLCEKRDAHMHEMGFWLEEHEDPREVPIMLHGEYGGATVWLTDDGWYADVAPAGRWAS